MQLNIKSEAANALIERMVNVTGESKTQAVTESLRLRLASLERDRDVQKRIDDVMRIADSIRSRLPEKLPTQAELDDMFYDEDGLPK